MTAQTLYDIGDKLHANRVAINASGFSKIREFRRAKNDLAFQTVAKGNVYCVIEQPLKARPKAQGPS